MTLDNKPDKISLSSIPRSIWFLGFVGMTLNSSAVMALILIPLLLRDVFNASMTTIGLIEGIVSATALIIRIFAGALSDIFHTRKKIMIVGYIIATVIKPIIGMAQTVFSVFVGFTIERISNALQATPRDALISDLAPRKTKGTCYGLRQMFGRIGSCTGPIIIIAFIYLFDKKFGISCDNPSNIKILLWISAIPAFIALLILIFFVKDSPKFPNKKELTKKQLTFGMSEIKQFSASYWKVVLIASIFMFARINEGFFIIRAKEIGFSNLWIPTVMIIMNFACAVAAYPIGNLSDKVGRRIPIIISFFMLAIADLFLAFSYNYQTLLIGIMFWGLQLGATESLLPTLVADTAPPPLRGSAFGLYYFISGIMQFITNYIAGIIWHTSGATNVYLLSALTAIISIILFLILMRKRKKVCYAA